MRIFDGDDYQQIGLLNLPDGVVANDIKVGDVDGDGTQEIVLPRSNDTLVYDA